MKKLALLALSLLCCSCQVGQPYAKLWQGEGTGLETFAQNKLKLTCSTYNDTLGGYNLSYQLSFDVAKGKWVVKESNGKQVSIADKQARSILDAAAKIPCMERVRALPEHETLIDASLEIDNQGTVTLYYPNIKAPAPCWSSIVETLIQLRQSMGKGQACELPIDKNIKRTQTPGASAQQIQKLYSLTPLMHAIVTRDKNAQRKLISDAMKTGYIISYIDTQNDYGKTALMMSCIVNDIEMVARLLAAGANPNLRDRKGNTALSLAQLYKRPKIAALLIDAGAME